MKTTVEMKNLGPGARLVTITTSQATAGGRQLLTAALLLAARTGAGWTLYDPAPEVAPADGGFEGRRVVGVAKSEQEIASAAITAAAERVQVQAIVEF